MSQQQPNQPQSQPGRAPSNPPGKPQDPRPHVSPDLDPARREQTKNLPGRSGQDAPRTEPSKTPPARTSGSSSSSSKQASDEEAARREENEGPAGLTTKPPSEQQPRKGEERFRPTLPGYSDPGDPRRLEVEGQEGKRK